MDERSWVCRSNRTLRGPSPRYAPQLVKGGKEQSGCDLGRDFLPPL